MPEDGVHDSQLLKGVLSLALMRLLAERESYGYELVTQLHELGASITDSVLLLDGSFDWLTPVLKTPLRVKTRVKADRDCASVAAASVVAKVHRDRLMIGYDSEYAGYGWSGNKGYGSSEHYAAIESLGPSALHRRTWLHPRDAVLID